MKYNAGNKYIRDTEWVKIPFRVHGIQKTEVHLWCNQQPGLTRFYHHYAGDHWWFEDEQDAIMFQLKWGDYKSKL